MEDGRCKDSLDGMSDGVSKVDEVTESRLAFVDGDDVRFDGNRADDDGE
jgi:hypothetical protein